MLLRIYNNICEINVLATKVLEELLCWGMIKFSGYYGFLKISKYKKDEKYLYSFKTNKKGT